MDRRKFLTTAGLAGAAAAASAASSFPKPAIAQGKRELKMVMTWPKNAPTLGTSAQRICDRITALTGGQLTCKLFGAGELVPAFESFDAVSQGKAEMYHSADYYWQGKSPAYNFFTTVPFGMVGYETHAWIQYGGGQELWDELGRDFNIKPFAAHSTGTQMLGWFRKDINGLDDLKGLKMRIPGLGGEVMRQLGVTVVNLPIGEIYPALQSGTIDAAEWVGPFQDLMFGFHKITKNYYYPGFHEPGTVNAVGVNLQVWESLSDEHKRVIEIVTQAEAYLQNAELNARNGEALETLKSKHEVSVKKLPDELVSEIRKIAVATVDDIGNRDPFTKKVYESHLAFQKKAQDWAQYSEYGFKHARATA